MSDKKLFRSMIIQAVIVTVLYLILQSGTLLVTGYNLEMPAVYYYDTYHTADNIDFTWSPEGVCEIKEFTEKDGVLYMTISPVSAGTTTLTVTEKDDGDQVASKNLVVEKSGMILDMETDNFSGWRLARIYVIALMVAYTLILIVGFMRSQRKYGYTYIAIFSIGLGIMFALIDFVLVLNSSGTSDMCNLYSSIRSQIIAFIYLTFPAILIFAVSMSISNLQLIRKEGFRIRNILGILISLVMIFGAAFVLFLDDYFYMGSDMEMRIYGAITNSIGAVYALFECFLIGSIICGIASAKHVPKFDKDYVVILGCKVRKDGTLYPLIKARVDRAIWFVKKQEEKTGRKAYFVPSGGQGRDEQISEADAMKNYLVSQGFDESRILVENKSKNTRENMMFSKAIIEQKNAAAGEGMTGKAAFSTTNFHVFRSGIISRQVDFDVEGMGAPTKWYFWPNAFMREVVGMVTYVWKVLIVILIPLVGFMIAIQFLIG